MNNFLAKLDRWAAIILMGVIILYAVSGYGMTKGLFDRDLARSLHLSWLAGVGLAAFVIHTAYALALACRRRQIWNKFTKTALVVFYILLAGFFSYIHFFYVSPEAGNRPLTQDAAGNQATDYFQATLSATSTVFTANTLAAYDGTGGRPAYAAVDGIVYDVSAVFRNGSHHGCQAGRDITADFYADHRASLLEGYPIVGVYQK